MKFYLAARFPRKDEMKTKADFLSALKGWEATCQWCYGAEEGKTRPQNAVMDLDDVANADIFILFSYKRGTKQPGGGRFVEFGYALAKKKRCIVIGPYENLFVHHPSVEVYPDWNTFIEHIRPAGTKEVI